MYEPAPHMPEKGFKDESLQGAASSIAPTSLQGLQPDKRSPSAKVTIKTYLPSSIRFS